MIYDSSSHWLGAQHKRVMLFGMSGLGKTHVSSLLRGSGNWFHYSVDYRIGTRYMGENIADNFKQIAMQNPELRDLLLSDSIYIASNITFDNLTPLSTYLGKPGDQSKGGLPFAEYLRRQEQHRQAEISALMDTTRFISRAEEIYHYDNFICDTSGSICEVVNPENPNDPVLSALADQVLMVAIEGSDNHTAKLIKRFDRAPKPMYYQPQFLAEKWAQYLALNKVEEASVNPDDFIRWAYAQALAHRQPRYAAMAKWGVKITADEISQIQSPTDFNDLIGMALDRRAGTQ
ncbi:MAG: ATPase [Rhodobacteraceae bacterium]|nr:ATPase [Paracoccaceae bacterium]RZO40593.1 MAG: ATPase [Paracoccaceae bacterium]